MEICQRSELYGTLLPEKGLISESLLIRMCKYFYVYLYFFHVCVVCSAYVSVFMWVIRYHSTHVEVNGQNPRSVLAFYTVWVSCVHCYINWTSCSVSFQTLPPASLCEWAGITDACAMHMDFTGFWGCKHRLVDRLKQQALYPPRYLSSLIYIHFNGTCKLVLSSLDWCAHPAFTRLYRDCGFTLSHS